MAAIDTAHTEMKTNKPNEFIATLYFQLRYFWKFAFADLNWMNANTLCSLIYLI